MRQISMDGLRQLLAEDMADFWITAIVIKPNPNDLDHATDEPLYLCANTEDIEYDGQVYTAFPMELTLAADQEDTVPRAKIKIDNLSREMAYIIRRTNYAPHMDLVVLRVKGDKSEVTLELGPNSYILLDATVTEATMEATLGYENDVLNEPAVSGHFTPTVCPGIF